MFALLTFLVVALSSFGQAGAAMSPVVKSSNPGFTMGVQESDATLFNTDATGATTINPYVSRQNSFSRVQTQGREVTQIGQSTQVIGETGLSLAPLFGASDGLWRFRRPVPTNAVFQAGPFFIQFHDITSALLVSDNVNLVPHNAEWGAIAEFRLRLSGILQITPTWRLSVSGAIIYLPFRNEFGVEGFGLGDALGVIGEGSGSPLTHMQLAYDSRWGKWNVQIVDDFRVRAVTINAGFNALANGSEQPEGIAAEDRAGRYVFGNGTTIPNENIDSRQHDFLDIRTFLELENLVGASFSRVLPTETRAIFGANHSDFWYQGNWGNGTNGIALANHSVDTVFASLINERESMRFKPYVFYDAYRYDYDPDWTHNLGAGFSGPITENMFVQATGGYTWSDTLLTDTWFYRFRLQQDPGPYTRQFWEYLRDVTEPVREIEDTYRYGIDQVLGPDLWGRFYMQRSVFQPNQLGVFESVEDRAATRVMWVPTPTHTYIIGGSYAENRFNNPTRDRETTWEARAEIRYRIRADIVLSLLYRYLNIDTEQLLQHRNTAENLWILSLRKYF